MNVDNKFETNIKSLKKNHAFQMSLSGKELFHSNMIAMFLTQEQDNTRLPTELSKTIAKKLFKPETWANPKEYVVFDVLREYQNLDLIICYCTQEEKDTLNNNNYFCVEDISNLNLNINNDEEQNSQSIEIEKEDDDKVYKALNHMHYVIVENKFKSFPYKEQLEKYSEKLEKGIPIFSLLKKGNKTKTYWKATTKNTTCYLFAPENSLKAFYGKNQNYCNQFSKAQWTGISYDTFKDTIESFGDENKADLMSQFIKAYHDFLKIMLNLYDNCVDKRLNNNLCFLSKGHNEQLLKIRVQDFYEKIIYNRLLIKLKNEPEKIIPENSEIKIIDNYSKDELWPYFYSTTNYSSQTGFLDFRYLWKDSIINAGIEIQGSSFRIVFCHEKDLLKKVYGFTSFTGDIQKKIKGNYKLNNLDDFDEQLKKFNEPDEITKTMACIKYIYNKIKKEIPNIPELKFKETKDNPPKETVYSYKTDKYSFCYGNCDLNEFITNRNKDDKQAYRELNYKTLKELIKVSLKIIGERSYEELIKDKEVLKYLNN